LDLSNHMPMPLEPIGRINGYRPGIFALEAKQGNGLGRAEADEIELDKFGQLASV